jgi:hypothetical protein
LLEACRAWKALSMVTLTIDPKQFASPLEAFRYLGKHRCVGRFVQDLKRAGVVMSHRWFSILEFQQNGMPHYHLLLESSWIDQAIARRCWNKQGPGPAMFGMLRLSKHFYGDVLHAVRYACKYVIKAPRHPMPAWAGELIVLRRHSHSHGLMPTEDDRKSSGGVETDRKIQSISKRLSSCGDPDKRLWEVLDKRGFVIGRAVKNPEAWLNAALRDELAEDARRRSSSLN